RMVAVGGGGGQKGAEGGPCRCGVFDEPARDRTPHRTEPRWTCEASLGRRLSRSVVRGATRARDDLARPDCRTKARAARGWTGRSDRGEHNAPPKHARGTLFREADREVYRDLQRLRRGGFHKRARTIGAPSRRILDRACREPQCELS